MSDNIVRLNYKEKEIILIATAHVSQESVALVKKTIDENIPDSICIELDDARYENIKNPEKWKETNLIDIIKNKKVGLLIANLILSSYQKNVAKKLNTKPGQEMMQGIASSKQYNTNLVLADRNIQTTFMRIWRSMNFFKKCKLILSFLFDFNSDEEVSEDDIQKLMQEGNLEKTIGEMGESFPEIARILLHERDQYLANKIKNAPGQKIIAVLGAAHVPGIKKEIFLEQDMEEITRIPKPSKFVKMLPWLIPGIIVGILVYGFISNIGTGIQQLKLWVLWNSCFASLFTALALGHPLSILTSFIAAPFTSLNPFIACGWFTGITEVSLRKPTVEDLDNISDDIKSIRGIFGNRFLKAILVIILTNVGSGIGTFIAGTDIIKNLF